jgi:helicase-like protein
MWEDYVTQYRMLAKVLSVSQVIEHLPHLRRYRLVLIDESHNLRNREGKRYKAIQDYIEKNDSHCILLTATPYNKSYLDLSAQLRLFIPPDKDLGIRPERKLSEIGETEFIRRHQCRVRSLAAFEQSEYADDWRELMRLFMVRRTRGFIQRNYAETDRQAGRRFLTFADGRRSYFPDRVPQTVKFAINDGDPHDQYARLYSPDVVDAVNNLYLPRYGLGNYVAPRPTKPPTQTEAKQLEGLSRAGKRLMGFCRTNLFKRLESGGAAFVESVERHVLRNYVYLHAIEHGLDLPLGTQDPALLDAGANDEDADAALPGLLEEDEGADEVPQQPASATLGLQAEADYRRRAAEVYAAYTGQFRKRFKWLRPGLFVPELREHLARDAGALLGVLALCGTWDPARDAKLNALADLLTRTYPREKVLIFTQFADTVRYLTRELKARGIAGLEGVTGDSADPTGLAWRFSPDSNGKRDRIGPGEELRALIATDVLSEGQNLQDCSIIVNYDLPWAIIRLIQRAGRVDRIGQQSPEIRCLSFLPADGVERIIRLRLRVRERLRQNAEVVGTDEAFFEDDADDTPILDIYNEKAGILDGDSDSEVDLASYAYQIWKNATDADPALQRIIPELPPVVYSTKTRPPVAGGPEGVLVYVRTADDNDALAWIDLRGQAVTQSQLAILRAAECGLKEPALPRLEEHHALVLKGLAHLASEEQQIGGQLGRPSGARFRVYERLKSYAERNKGTLWESEELARAVDDIYRFPLQQTAKDTLNRQLKASVSDETLAELVKTLRDEDRLCYSHDEERAREPRLICSLGLRAGSGP